MSFVMSGWIQIYIPPEVFVYADWCNNKNCAHYPICEYEDTQIHLACLFCERRKAKDFFCKEK